MGRKYFENCSGLHSQHDVHFTELVASGCCCSRSSPFLFEQKNFMRGGGGGTPMVHSTLDPKVLSVKPNS